MLYNASSNNSPSTSSDDEQQLFDEMSPTQLLSLAIKKRRTLYNCKERDYHRELLQTSFITSLCKHMGESRKRRRRGGKKRSSSGLSGAGNDSISSTTSDEGKLDTGEPLVQNTTDSPTQAKRRCTIDADPFGLEEFFKKLSENKDHSSKLVSAQS